MENERYNSTKIEEKWRKKWKQEKTFKVNVATAKKPFYNLMMFPYPSGEGLHVGHVYAFGGSDTYGRLKRLQGYDVFEPMGFDSFGIHSENYAIKTGIHPQDLIKKTTSYFKEKQLERLGALFDWDHQLITSDIEYYKWTQWLFIQFFKAGLAVRKEAPVDWCPSCKTVLADEQVIEGKCERCSSAVVQKELAQWFLRITQYSEKLLKNLNTIDWSSTTKLMQKNWIGKSEGTEIQFKVKDSNKFVAVYTTRPDTIFGATFLVLAPEHELALKISTAKYFEATKKYVADSLNKSEIERSKAKTGVFTGAYAINPLNNAQIPIWVADYVLSGYGTGAIMAVPAHDSRDFEFAKEHKIEIVEVIKGGDISKEAYLGEGNLVNSGDFNEQFSKEAIKNISEYIKEHKFGTDKTNYHLRDWLISRQRYWGPPIPMIFCELCAKKGKSWFTTSEAKEKKQVSGNNSQLFNLASRMSGWYTVPEENLPVELPFMKDYQPRGQGVSPLATLPDFLSVVCPGCGNSAKRETDVSDTFLDSAWYYLRYPSTKSLNSTKVPFDPKITQKWLPVDNYIGGNEHAVMHLLYTRFVTMALSDMGYLDFDEPFKKFRAHGLIIHDGAKMSKSRGNVINPNQYMDSYGSDTLRTYLLFIGPYEQGGDFSDRAIAGVYRFYNRVWNLITTSSSLGSNIASSEMNREINKLIEKVEADTENLKFNTAIASIMEFSNFVSRNITQLDLETVRKFLIILSIFAPFTSEELWEKVGFEDSVHSQSWPKIEQKYLMSDQVNLIVQINGKFRDALIVDKSLLKSQNDAINLAKKSNKISKYLHGKSVVKAIYVPYKLLNLLVK